MICFTGLIGSWKVNKNHLYIANKKVQALYILVFIDFISKSNILGYKIKKKSDREYSVYYKYTWMGKYIFICS